MVFYSIMPGEETKTPPSTPEAAQAQQSLISRYMTGPAHASLVAERQQAQVENKNQPGKEKLPWLWGGTWTAEEHPLPEEAVEVEKDTPPTAVYQGEIVGAQLSRGLRKLQPRWALPRTAALTESEARSTRFYYPVRVLGVRPGYKGSDGTEVKVEYLWMDKEPFASNMRQGQYKGWTRAWLKQSDLRVIKDRSQLQTWASPDQPLELPSSGRSTAGGSSSSSRESRWNPTNARAKVTVGLA